MEDDEQGLIVKVIVLGDSGVGKTSLLHCFNEEQFSVDFLSTIGVEYYTKTIEVKGNKLRIQAWDTSGQERFRTIAPTFIKKAIGFILVYCVDDRKSFESIAYWMEQIKSYANPDVTVVLVASKIDIPDRLIESEEGRVLAETHNMEFFETSSKDNINVKETFEAVGRGIIKNLKLTKIAEPRLTHRLSTKKVKEKSDPKKCCQ